MAMLCTIVLILEWGALPYSYQRMGASAPTAPIVLPPIKSLFIEKGRRKSERDPVATCKAMNSHRDIELKDGQLQQLQGDMEVKDGQLQSVPITDSLFLSVGVLVPLACRNGE